MNIALWVVAVLLAIPFFISGILKAVTPKEKLAANERMAWAEDFSPNMIRFIGVMEALGAIGLIAPWATGIAPILTPLAALGLFVVMVGAAIVHKRRNEPMVPNIVLGALALFVAVGRF